MTLSNYVRRPLHWRKYEIQCEGYTIAVSIPDSIRKLDKITHHLAAAFLPTTDHALFKNRDTRIKLLWSENLLPSFLRYNRVCIFGVLYRVLCTVYISAGQWEKRGRERQIACNYTISYSRRKEVSYTLYTLGVVQVAAAEPAWRGLPLLNANPYYGEIHVGGN